MTRRKKMLQNKELLHNKRTNEFKLHPRILGLDDILMSTGEVNIYRQDYNLIRQPDNLMFDYNNKRLYNVEYKVNKGHRAKAIKQLRDSAVYLRMMFPQYKVVNLYINGNYKIEEIK